ncbi:MAG: hypothetical protein V2A73_00095 [Pseudomonadota bacterium]
MGQAGQPLNSGANRGDWLYTAAVYHYGSWGEAVKAAGFSYTKIRIRPLTAREVIRERYYYITDLAAAAASSHIGN